MPECYELVIPWACRSTYSRPRQCGPFQSSTTLCALEIVDIPPSQLPAVLLTTLAFDVEHLLMILPGHTTQIPKHGHCYSIQRPLGLPGSNILRENKYPFNTT